MPQHSRWVNDLPSAAAAVRVRARSSSCLTSAGRPTTTTTTTTKTRVSARNSKKEKKEKEREKTEQPESKRYACVNFTQHAPRQTHTHTQTNRVCMCVRVWKPAAWIAPKFGSACVSVRLGVLVVWSPQIFRLTELSSFCFFRTHKHTHTHIHSKERRRFLASWCQRWSSSSFCGAHLLDSVINDSRIDWYLERYTLNLNVVGQADLENLFVLFESAKEL